MGVSPISFLSFKVIFHWTMIVGERISTGGSPKKGTWTFPNRCVGRFLFGTWNPPGAAFLFASLENIRRYHFVRQLDCWFLGVSKFMDINSSLGHFWRVFGATNASSSTDSLGFLWCFFWFWLSNWRNYSQMFRAENCWLWGRHLEYGPHCSLNMLESMLIELQKWHLVDLYKGWNTILV